VLGRAGGSFRGREEVWCGGREVCHFVSKGPGKGGVFLLALSLEVFKNSVENFTVWDCVFFVVVVVHRRFLVDIETLYGVQVNVFFLGLKNFHDVLYIAKCMLVCC
jgi:hypothetical protein